MPQSKKEILMTTFINLLKKKKFNRIDSNNYWPKSKQETIQWFPFLTIMEYTTNIMKTNNGLISSLLKVFSMFELSLNYKEGKLDVISISCINFKRETVVHHS